MGLVDYSDSEGSDSEDAPPASTTTTPPRPAASIPTSQKVVNPSGPRKIKVDLPTTPAEEDAQATAPPAKRARTAGTFSGFNSLLPAPKKAAAVNAPRAGVSLRTSSEAAFSRVPPPRLDSGDGENEPRTDEHANGHTVTRDGGMAGEPIVVEPKLVGKATKFKPLSVGNRKKPAIKRTSQVEDGINGSATKTHSLPAKHDAATTPEQPAPKPKRSLFSVPQQEEPFQQSASAVYQPITDENNEGKANDAMESTAGLQPSPGAANPNTLQSITSDLNLTAAQRRQLFGRHAKPGTDVNIAHFNMESEYAANEQLRQAGDAVEQRAVKAIAPGKHSLQQLVNNARSQQDAMEDKWSQGKADRGEGGAKYGWGR